MGVPSGDPIPAKLVYKLGRKVVRKVHVCNSVG
jgi:hypothetical protein